ncbi:hypothetical protein PoB_003821200 [Plakobranchus ocellatus]|uniref:Uncharacterized protein n=1 Tax=Plakobranchus ocellatus TaxID=259542 RepID=A0AAV4AWQ7_9GAST|nr:hypothetical protein PoB_003821200 [Plakobranchus ocellatus]
MISSNVPLPTAARNAPTWTAAAGAEDSAASPVGACAMLGLITGSAATFENGDVAQDVCREGSGMSLARADIWLALLLYFLTLPK